jgi:HK97 gp10 family phage protein
MNITVRTTIRDNRIPSIIATFPGAISKVVTKTAFDIEASAKVICPVDTGALSGSIKADVKEFTATIAPHKEYDAYVEFGTIKMAAQPYMRPAADLNEPKFTAAIDAIVKAM